jgi:hypothetical protein
MLQSATITWRPGFNDNDFSGWLVTAGYVVTVLACFWRARQTRATADSTADYSGVWRGIGIVLLLLGINQQLDLHVLIIEAVRDLAKAEGWYKHRRLVQKVFFGVFAAALLAGAACSAWRWRRFFAGQRLVTAGLLLLLGWLLFRAALIEHVGEGRTASLRADVWRDYLELGALIVVGAGVWRSLRTR